MRESMFGAWFRRLPKLGRSPLCHNRDRRRSTCGLLRKLAEDPSEICGRRTSRGHPRGEQRRWDRRRQPRPSPPPPQQRPQPLPDGAWRPSSAYSSYANAHTGAGRSSREIADSLYFSEAAPFAGKSPAPTTQHTTPKSTATPSRPLLSTLFGGCSLHCSSDAWPLIVLFVVRIPVARVHRSKKQSARQNKTFAPKNLCKNKCETTTKMTTTRRRRPRRGLGRSFQRQMRGRRAGDARIATLVSISSPTTRVDADVSSLVHDDDRDRALDEVDVLC